VHAVRCTGPGFLSRHENSRNLIGEKFACHDTSPNRDIKVRRTTSFNGDDARQNRHGDYSRCIREHKFDLRTCRICPNGEDAVICDASKHRNCYRKQFYGRRALYRWRELGRMLRRIISSSVDPFRGLNLTALRNFRR